MTWSLLAHDAASGAFACAVATRGSAGRYRLRCGGDAIGVEDRRDELEGSQGHAHFDRMAEFIELYDTPAFDPAAETLALA